MARTEFDIYQVGSGFVAVTSPVRRKILHALAQGPLQLPQLVKTTGRAKPTLSSVHLRDLLAAGLIEEYPDPADSRRKFYRLTAKPIGSSTVPVDQLREAVRTYAGQRIPAAAVSLAGAIRILLAAPSSTPAAGTRAQAAQLGAELAPSIQGGSARAALQALADLLEKDGLATPHRLDLESLELDLELAPGVASRASAHRIPHLLEGVLEGICGALPVVGRMRASCTPAGRGRFNLRVEG